MKKLIFFNCTFTIQTGNIMTTQIIITVVLAVLIIGASILSYGFKKKGDTKAMYFGIGIIAVFVTGIFLTWFIH